MLHDRLRSEIAALSPQRRLAMLSAAPVFRGDLLMLADFVAAWAQRLPAKDRQTMALRLAQHSADLGRVLH